MKNIRLNDVVFAMIVQDKQVIDRVQNIGFSSIKSIKKHFANHGYKGMFKMYIDNPHTSYQKEIDIQL